MVRAPGFGQALPLREKVRPLRKLFAFPDDNTGKNIWNGVSQG